jgi:hypothetical protein
MSVTSVSSTAGLAVGQVVAGLGVPSGTTITHVNSGNSSLSLSKSLEPAAASTTINVVANSFTVTGNVTSGSTTVSNLSSTSGLYAGMMVSGSGIPDGTYISCLLAQGCSSTATLSNAATATVTADTLFITPWTKVGTMVIGNSAAGNINNGIDFTGDLTAGSTAIANVASAAYLSDIGVSAGAPLAGYGVAPGTTVSAIAANGITMSQAAVASVTTQSLIVQPAALIVSPFTGTVTAGSKAVTSLSSSAGLSTNMLIEGVGLATGLSITSVSSTGLSLSSSATLSATGDSFFVSPRIPVTGITGTETFGSTVLSGLSSVSSLAIGDFITGFGIPAGTLITSVSAGLSSSTSLSISISNPATASQSNVAFIAGYYPPLTATAMTGSLNGTQGIVASSSALPFVGEVLAAANLPSSTIVSSVAGTTLGLTQSASASLSSTTFYPTFAPCPGPAKKIGTTTPNGLYGAPNALIGVYGGSSDPAPIAQHSGATAAASINSQIWPQPGTANTGLGSATSNPNSLQGNYIDQRDNQFYNRMFTDSYGTPLKFNVLVFQVLPYVYPTKPTTYSTVNSTCTTDTLGRVVCQYGMLFEGAKACYTDSYSASCTMTGNDEWWNPPVAETQDCGQDPS